MNASIRQPRPALVLAALAHLLLTFLPCALLPLVGVAAEWNAKWTSLACLAVVALLSYFAEIQAVGDRDDLRSQKISPAVAGAWLTGLLLLVVIWIGLVELAGRMGEPAAVLLIGGSAMAGLGTALRYEAIRHLGAGFRTELSAPDTTCLATTGPYAWLRHPSELGLLLQAGGSALLLQSWLAAIVVIAALLPLVILRLRFEEATLHQRFGDKFTAYRQRTPLLVPWRLGG